MVKVSLHITLHFFQRRIIAILKWYGILTSVLIVFQHMYVPETFNIPFWSFPHKWSRFVWIILHLAHITNIITIFKFKLLQFNSRYVSSEMPKCLSYSNILPINRFVCPRLQICLKCLLFYLCKKANTIWFFSIMASPYLVRLF